MKKILSLLIVSLFAISLVGVVSANSWGVEFTSPMKDEGVSNELIVEWTNKFDVEGLYLQYTSDGDCSLDSDWDYLAGPLTSIQTTFEWDTNGVDDGEYCLRIGESLLVYDTSDPFTIDNTAPFASVVVVENQQGMENDSFSEETASQVSIVASDNIQLDYCMINWGDGSNLKDCLAKPSKIYKHQYNDNGDYPVTLIVKDKAGNEVSALDIVSVENVAPTITTQIDAPNNGDVNEDGLNESAVGEAVKFTASGNDVDADLEAGLTCIWTFDGANPKPTTADELGDCEVYYTWDSASVHTVDLTISDKDGGSVDADQFELEVKEPEPMTPMQRVVAGENFTFELDEQWAVKNKKRFKTSLTFPVTCIAVVVPTGMVISSPGGDPGRCQVDWTPSNAQRGEHLVIIKAYNDANEYKYYSFDVTVYSWGIELVPGWNLISVPYMPVDSSIEAVLGDIRENIYRDSSTWTVYQYDGVSGEWLRTRTTQQDWSTAKKATLKYIVPGYGYWIKMENPDTIYGIEDNFPVNTVPGATGINLATESWNLIGRFGALPNPLLWRTAFESLRKPFYMDNYVSPKLGIYKLDSVTPGGDTTWSDATDIEVANGYWVRTAAGSEGRETVIYEPDTI